MLFKRVTETKITRLEAKNTQLEAVIELKDQQHVNQVLLHSGTKTFYFDNGFNRNYLLPKWNNLNFL